MSLTYKEATENDIPIITALVDRIWRKHYEPIIGPEQVEYMLNKMYHPDNILQQMKDQQHYTLAYDNNTPIGYISVSTKNNKNYFLHKFYVESGERRKGIGSQIFEHLLKNLETLETIELTVNRQNYKAINFYFKKGFVIKAVEDFDIGNGYFMNDFVMIASSEALASMKRLPNF